MKYEPNKLKIKSKRKLNKTSEVYQIGIKIKYGD